MTSSNIVTFTTDFGSQDSYVGQMKGAALSIRRELMLIDLCHEVPAHDVVAGSYLLETGYAAFPAGTIHVAVVDPGVGSERAALAVETQRYIFLAPDNGLLTRVLEREPPRRVHRLQTPRFRAADVSATFEGRDVFSPAAAWIAAGTDLAELGPEWKKFVRLRDARPTIAAGVPLRIPVLLIDRFGNVVLDLPRSDWPTAAHGETTGVTVRTPRGEISRLLRTYAEATDQDPFLLFNSAGYLEIAIRSGRADRRLELLPGASVELQLDDGR